VLYTCKGVHTLFASQRERERECTICPELLLLFFKGMTGAFAPFGCLILYILSIRMKCIVLFSFLAHKGYKRILIKEGSNIFKNIINYVIVPRKLVCLPL
jgi:hypothetical protein